MRNLKTSLAALFISALVIILTILIASTGCVHAQTVDIDRKPEAPKNHATTLDSVIADSVGVCNRTKAIQYLIDNDLDCDGILDECSHIILDEHMTEDPNVDKLMTQILWHSHFYTCLDKNSDGEIDDDQHPELYPKKYGTYINPSSIYQDDDGIIYIYTPNEDDDWGHDNHYHGKEGKSEFGEYQPSDNFDWDQGFCGD